MQTLAHLVVPNGFTDFPLSFIIASSLVHFSFIFGIVLISLFWFLVFFCMNFLRIISLNSFQVFHKFPSTWGTGELYFFRYTISCILYSGIGASGPIVVVSSSFGE